MSQLGGLTPFLFVWRHDIDDPDERDIYPYLDQPIPTVKAIYIVPDKHRGSLKALPEEVQEAFESGNAVFVGDL